MSVHKRLPAMAYSTLVVFGLNLLIYWRAKVTLKEPILVFAECARNSGRTAAAINLFLLIILIVWGLRSIYASPKKKLLFQTSVFAFAVNHVIHFYFVSRNFEIHDWPVGILDNLHGFITYLLIVFTPILLIFYRRLTKGLYAFTILHLTNVTYFIGISFYGRIKPIDPAYLHQIGIWIMILAVIGVLARIIKNWRFEMNYINK